ncbi:MAG: hypothetical protein BMS9Abin12_1467 [Acidimicrobiia bacterium]|nr:MAG: hypothetical protein BMS9Abin12_1467 [Acidimicrobiia bacterium]
MESEEFEQIPWANLVAEQTDGIDKRVYIAAAIVGALLIAAFGMRLLGGSSQPLPSLPVTAELPQPTMVESTPSTSMVIAEADLRADDTSVMDSADRLVEITAEWFVTDWFTRDGSDETVRSIKAALSNAVVLDAIPHETEGEPVTFVEWAKTIGSEVTPNGVDVTIVYRAIRETKEGFVRDPVATVVVSLVRTGDRVTVVSLPKTDD